MSASAPSEVEEFCQVQMKVNGKWVPIGTEKMNLSESLAKYNLLKASGTKVPLRAVRIHIRYSPFESTEWDAK